MKLIILELNWSQNNEWINYHLITFITIIVVKDKLNYFCYLNFSCLNLTLLLTNARLLTFEHYCSKGNETKLFIYFLTLDQSFMYNGKHYICILLNLKFHKVCNYINVWFLHSSLFELTFDIIVHFFNFIYSFNL